MEETVIEEKGTESEATIEKKGVKDLLHILEDLPPFIGHNRTYYLKKEDFVSLPSDLGEVLLKSGKVKRVME